MHTNQKNSRQLTGAAIVIPDECGDSLWDAVLEQDLQANSNGNAASQLNALPVNQDTPPVTQ